MLGEDVLSKGVVGDTGFPALAKHGMIWKYVSVPSQMVPNVTDLSINNTTFVIFNSIFVDNNGLFTFIKIYR